MVGKSKVISGLNDWQAHRRRKDTIMGSSVGSDAWAQVRDPKGTIGELFEPTFNAGLTNNDTARTPGGNFLPATVTRNSEAVYRGKQALELAAVNESRQEWIGGAQVGTLMEPAITNKCLNYNANPDAALINVQTVGDPAGVFARVQDVAELASAGLSNICTSGYVLKLDNTAGSTNAGIIVLGSSGNTNMHTISAYCRIDAASSGPVRFEFAGGSGELVNSVSYQRYETSRDGSTTSRVQLTVEPNGIGYMILNQLEEQPVAGSVIVTQGAAGSRAADQIEWPLSGLINQTQGMGALMFRPSGTSAMQGTNTSRHLLLGATSANPWIDHRSTSNVGAITDGTTSVITTLAYAANQIVLLMWRWGSSTMDITNKQGGTVATWSAGAYDGSFVVDSVLKLGVGLQFPAHYRSIYIWDEDKGRAWLESYFSGIAN